MRINEIDYAARRNDVSKKNAKWPWESDEKGIVECICIAIARQVLDRGSSKETFRTAWRPSCFTSPEVVWCC